MSSITSDLTGLALQNGWSTSPGSQIAWLVSTSGEASFHDNVILFGFEDTNPVPILVAKASRLPENGWMLQVEYDHLKTMWGLLRNHAKKYLPEPLAFATINNQPVFITNYLAGESLQQVTRKNFWHKSSQVKELMIQAAESLREIHELSTARLELHEKVTSDFPQKAAAFQKMFPLEPNEFQAVNDLVGFVSTRSMTAKYKVMIQGDFWHGNLIRAVDHDRLMFVDWQFARWAVDASFDVYLFPLAAALNSTAPSQDTARAEQAYRVLCLWQKDVLPAYLKSYGTPDLYSLLPEREGMLVSCIEKAARSITDFGNRHPDDILWRSLFRKLLSWPSPSAS